MTDTRENKEASLQAIYVKIARIAAETNPIDMTAAESGHSTSSNVVRLSQMIARGARRGPECAHDQRRRIGVTMRASSST